MSEYQLQLNKHFTHQKLHNISYIDVMQVTGLSQGIAQGFLFASLSGQLGPIY